MEENEFYAIETVGSTGKGCHTQNLWLPYEIYLTRCILTYLEK
jgi:hypothetical protein